MSSTSKNMKATVEFGATVSSSFGSATTKIANDVKSVGRSVSDLTSKQEKLGKSIKDGMMAGRSVDKLVGEYQKLGRQIEWATNQQTKLNKELTQAEKREKTLHRLGSPMRGIGRATKWGVKTGGKAIGSSIVNSAKWAGAGMLGGAAAAIASPIMLNAETAEKLGQAKSYGLGIGTYQTLGIIAKQAGLNAENGGDLAEELSNKMGESGNEKSLNPMLAQLGFTKARLAKFSKEEQFQKVLSQLMKIDNPTQASSLADQLMGGEGNKLLTYMKSTGKSYEEAMANASRYNLLSQDGAEGAMKANIAVGNLWNVAITGMEDTVGKITGKLAPTIDNAALSLADWIKGMEPKIEGAVSDWMKPDGNGETGPQRLWKSMVKFADGTELVAEEIMAVAKRLSFLIPDDPNKVAQEHVDKSTGTISSWWHRHVAHAWSDEEGDAYDSAMAAKTGSDNGVSGDKEQPLDENGSLMPFNERKNNDSVLMRPPKQLSIPPQVKNYNNLTFNVTTQQGQDPTQFAQSMYDIFQNNLGSSSLGNAGTGDMYDHNYAD